MSMALWHPSTWTVRVRILLTILLVAAFGMVATGAVTFLVQREATLEKIDHRLAQTVKEVQLVATSVKSSSQSNQGKNTASGTQKDNQRTLVQQVLRTSLQRIIPDSNESVLGIIGGKAALTSGAKASFAIQDDKAFVARVVKEVTGSDAISGTARTSLGALTYVAIPVTDGETGERGIFVSAYNLDAEMASISNSIRVFALSALGTLVIIAAVGAVVAGRLLRPIRQLQETAANITTSDLSQRIPVRGSDDVSNMAATVNEMLERISQGMDDQRQLLDDVRHELRTPLTIVRGHLELMDAGDAADVRETRDLVIDELDRMNNLVSDIALLNEASSTSASGISRHDISEFATSVCEKAKALSTARVWNTDFQASGNADFDADRITQAWLQIAENAVKYSEPDTEITLGTRLLSDGEHWQLYVSDHGIGIAPEMRSKVFERFQRTGQSRGVDGSGLGLAIVQAIANVHGGKAEAQATGAGGTTVSMTLPLKKASVVSEQVDSGDEK